MSAAVGGLQTRCQLLLEPRPDLPLNFADALPERFHIGGSYVLPPHLGSDRSIGRRDLKRLARCRQTPRTQRHHGPPSRTSTGRGGRARRPPSRRLARGSSPPFGVRHHPMRMNRRSHLLRPRRRYPRRRAPSLPPSSPRRSRGGSLTTARQRATTTLMRPRSNRPERSSRKPTPTSLEAFAPSCREPLEIVTTWLREPL